jgi:hypothetical protein
MKAVGCLSALNDKPLSDDAGESKGIFAAPSVLLS